MELIQSKKASINYLSKIVNITSFRTHPNAEKLKCCTVDGFNIIVGIDYEPGLYVYFPALSCINSDFLSYANLYRKAELNRNADKTGMFEENGRVKAVKLRGEISEGFLIPLNILQDYIVSITNNELTNVTEGTEFDSIKDGEKEFWLSKKYTIQRQASYKISKSTKKQPRGLDRIREDQFRFHYETILLRKYPFILNPEDLIQISYKMHGTSGISAYVLCHQPLNWRQKIAKWLTGESFDDYGHVYSSRNVIKDKYYNPKIQNGYYGLDVWAEADKIIRPQLAKGETVYYEIVGYLPNGRYIQKDYDYGCVPPEPNEQYTVGKHFRILIYRVTSTNVDGLVHEYSTQEVRQWCNNRGLYNVEEAYYGKAEDLYPDIPRDDKWNENFINRLANDKNFYMECNSPHCVNKVPHEGLVIKIEDGKSRAFKLKCFKFINKIDMSEEPNLEDIS